MLTFNYAFMYILPFRNQGEFKTLDFLSYISYKQTRVGLVYFVYDKVFDPKYSLQVLGSILIKINVCLIILMGSI